MRTCLVSHEYDYSLIIRDKSHSRLENTKVIHRYSLHGTKFWSTGRIQQ